MPRLQAADAGTAATASDSAGARRHPVAQHRLSHSHHEAALSLATAQLAAAHAEALAALAAREADIAALQAQLRQVTAERDALRAAASRHPSGADAAVDPAVEASGLSEDGGKVPLSHADSAPWTARDRCRDATVRVSPVALAPKRRRAGGPVERDPGLGPDPEDQKRLRLSQAATQACPLGWPSYANDARDDERGGRGDDGGGLIDRNSKDMPEDVPPGSPESPERSPEEPRPPAASIELPEARKAPPARSRRVARSPPSPQMAMAAADPPPSAPQPVPATPPPRRAPPMSGPPSSPHSGSSPELASATAHRRSRLPRGGNAASGPWRPADPPLREGFARARPAPTARALAASAAVASAAAGSTAAGSTTAGSTAATASMPRRSSGSVAPSSVDAAPDRPLDRAPSGRRGGAASTGGVPPQPEPAVVYDTVVRNRAARARMHAVDCPCCRDYYTAVGPLPRPAGAVASAAADRLQLVSRHRHVAPPPQTPSGFWELDFPPTAPQGNDSPPSRAMAGDGLPRRGP